MAVMIASASTLKSSANASCGRCHSRPLVSTSSSNLTIRPLLIKRALYKGHWIADRLDKDARVFIFFPLCSGILDALRSSGLIAGYRRINEGAARWQACTSRVIATLLKRYTVRLYTVTATETGQAQEKPLPELSLSTIERITASRPGNGPELDL